MEECPYNGTTFDWETTINDRITMSGGFPTDSEIQS